MAFEIAQRITEILPMDRFASQVFLFVQQNLGTVAEIVKGSLVVGAIYVYNKISYGQNSAPITVAVSSQSKTQSSASASSGKGGNGDGSDSDSDIENSNDPEKKQINKLLNESKKMEPEGRGRSVMPNWDRKGGWKQANDDFNSFPVDTKVVKGNDGKQVLIKDLKNGTTRLILRENPQQLITLEIQRKIPGTQGKFESIHKIRYNV